MKVLDLFAGLGGWSAAFRDGGHEVQTVEINPALPATIHADVRAVAADPDRYLGGWRPDVILASPPCAAFSVAGNLRHFTPPPHRRPKDDEGRLALQLVESILSLVRDLKPSWWWMENPRGLLRKMPAVKGLRRVTVSYCRYGERVMKPTDLWGSFPPSWQPARLCSNGDPCHVRVPRGSRTGTQGKNGNRIRPNENPEWRAHPDWASEAAADAQERAIVPYALSESVCRACEDTTPAPSSLEAFCIVAKGAE